MSTMKEVDKHVAHGPRPLPVEGSQDEPYLRMTINQLPDDVLLDIFKFYVDIPRVRNMITCGRTLDRWQVLVHVCQRWRCLVFASFRGLDLEVVCTIGRPLRKKLDIWPDFLIVVYAVFATWKRNHAEVADMTFALRQHNRVSAIEIIDIPNSMLKEFAEMETPYPVLTHLVLRSPRNDWDEHEFVPDSFLGGSAPRLRVFHLESVPFPALPNLLSSTTHLVSLKLERVPPSGFISPNAMVTGLSASKRLETLHLTFRASRSGAHRREKNRHSPAVTRTILPALTDFRLSNDGEYVEAFVSQIDTPVLEFASITFSDRPERDSPSLRHFISRTEAFKAGPANVIGAIEEGWALLVFRPFRL